MPEQTNVALGIHTQQREQMSKSSKAGVNEWTRTREISGSVGRPYEMSPEKIDQAGHHWRTVRRYSSNRKWYGNIRGIL